MMGNSVRKPRNDTEQREHPNTPIPVPFALRSVLVVTWRAPNGAPACTRFRFPVGMEGTSQVWDSESVCVPTDRS